MTPHDFRRRAVLEPANTGINTCSIEGCERPVKAREWCKAHYGRWQRIGLVEEVAIRPYVSPPPHGTCSRYVNQRCRCGPCTAANRLQSRKRRAAGPTPNVTHGIASTYSNYSCRCSPCTEAGAVANKQQYTQRKAAALTAAG